MRSPDRSDLPAEPTFIVLSQSKCCYLLRNISTSTRHSIVFGIKTIIFVIKKLLFGIKMFIFGI
jgi:hypothetical protein